VCFDACFRFSFGSGAHDHALSSEIVEQLVEEPWNYIAPLSSVPSADRRRSSHSRAWLRSPFLRQQSHLSGSSSLSVGLLVRKMFFRHAGKMRCGRCMHHCAYVCAIRLQCVPSRDFILRNDRLASMQNVAVCTTRGSLASIELFLWVALRRELPERCPSRAPLVCGVSPFLYHGHETGVTTLRLSPSSRSIPTSEHFARAHFGCPSQRVLFACALVRISRI